MRARLALASALVAALSACGMGPVTSGTVVDKQASQEERDVTEEVCEYETKRVNGKSKRVRDCDEEVVGTETVDVFELTLEDEEGETGAVEVSQEEYDSVEIGDSFGG